MSDALFKLFSICSGHADPVIPAGAKMTRVGTGQSRRHVELVPARSMSKPNRWPMQRAIDDTGAR